MGDEQSGSRSYLKLPGVGGIPAVGALGVGFISDRLTDAVSLLSSLPEIGATLQSINAHIINLDSEVTLMREGVNRLEGDVNGLRQEIGELRLEIADVNLHVKEMSGRLESMEPDIESLGRFAGLLRRTRRRPRDPSTPALPPGATDDASVSAEQEPSPARDDAGLTLNDPHADAAEALSEAAQALIAAAEAASLPATEEPRGFEPPYEGGTA